MKAVANRDNPGGEFSGFGDRRRHGLPAGDLAERVTGVEDGCALPVGNDGGGFIAGHRALA